MGLTQCAILPVNATWQFWASVRWFCGAKARSRRWRCGWWRWTPAGWHPWPPPNCPSRAFAQSDSFWAWLFVWYSVWLSGWKRQKRDRFYPGNRCFELFVDARTHQLLHIRGCCLRTIPRMKNWRTWSNQILLFKCFFEENTLLYRHYNFSYIYPIQWAFFYFCISPKSQWCILLLLLDDLVVKFMQLNSHPIQPAVSINTVTYQSST